MKKTYKIEVDCANCAQKMEDAANTVSGVAKATVSFMTQKMNVEFAEGADPKATMQNVLAACKKAIRKGGLGPCAANGANEEAVKLFLEDKIGFLDIGRLVEAVVDSDSFGGDYTLSDVYECDRMARAYVEAHI